MTTFQDLGLAAPLLSALKREGYDTPTPIQAQAIPPAIEGRDLLGIAQTGTGKTAAFALPILHRLAANPIRPRGRTCRVLVLSPTRELASQIAESFRTYGASLHLKVAVVFGGVGHGPQARAMGGGLDVLVATPGRLLDHLGERALDLSETEVFVLDEADQMFDLGFIKPIRQIASKLPAKRQNLFFSATMPPEIGKLAAEHLKNPAHVSVTPAATTVERIQQKVVFVEHSRKRALLMELFADPSWTRTLVFTRTKRGADRVADFLEAGGVEAAAIHGDKRQSQRERALAEFKAGRVRALVATDIAARGIDVDGVTHVVNFDLPEVPEAYVHRIGRTARAGADGIAVAFCSDDERPLLKDVERITRQKISTEDRRNDAALRGLDAAIAQAAGQRAATGAPRGEGGGGESRDRNGPSRNGQGRNGQGRNGQARNGQARNGQSRNGQGRGGFGRSASEATPPARPNPGRFSEGDADIRGGDRNGESRALWSNHDRPAPERPAQRDRPAPTREASSDAPRRPRRRPGSAETSSRR